jgi:hypothetical protein
MFQILVCSLSFLLVPLFHVHADSLELFTAHKTGVRIVPQFVVFPQFVMDFPVFVPHSPQSPGSEAESNVERPENTSGKVYGIFPVSG